MRLRFLLAAAFVLPLACMHAAGSSMSARVLGAPPGAPPSAAAPVAGAHLLLNCPDGMRVDLGRTDRDGNISISPSSAPAVDCHFTVVRAGYQTDTFSVGDACTQRAGNVCLSMQVTRVLQAAGSAGY